MEVEPNNYFWKSANQADEAFYTVKFNFMITIQKVTITWCSK